MSAHEPEPTPAAEERPLSVRDLLASCAAADAVSTPPKAPEPARADDEGDDARDTARDAA
ncbi:hypothetical protein ABZ545_16865 [Streptomyces abikoensis]|uniref:Uncharacterized protein n=2 Tax=Streptomyces TaxID=1883 RepID=A0A3Q9FWV7_STRLT|nr:hypothetical protein [Streptomyces luteoverticillatus]AZQ72107.1 hypothetical protein EKH77_13585 [Streptomyces luteoverticillatus]